MPNVRGIVSLVKCGTISLKVCLRIGGPTLGGATLGLDIGRNFIGWALVDEKYECIIGTGVRVFPEGVDRDRRGDELSRNKERRMFRGKRRQIARRSRRRRLLRAALVQAGLAPSDPKLQIAVDRLDPYALRRRGLDGPLSLHEFGRVLLQLAQRRGFLSNGKSDYRRGKETSDMLAAIGQLEAEIADAGSRTLGEHLVKLLEEDPFRRVRARHTARAMFEAEFGRLWEEQQKHHPGTLTDALRYGAAGRTSYPCAPRRRAGADFLAEFGIHGLLFFQRALYWPRAGAGRCELETKERRCPRGDRLAQKCRLLLDLNNLRLVLADAIVPLSDEQRSNVWTLLARQKQVTFLKLRGYLGLPADVGISLELAGRTKLDGMRTDCLLADKDMFGKRWHALPEGEKNAIVKSLLEDDEATVRRRAVEEWGVSPTVAERLVTVDLGEGYSRLSRKAIHKLLPYLEQGMTTLGDLKSPSLLAAAGYLRPNGRMVQQCDFLPETPSVTNPFVKQALYEVRKVVNAIIREFGKPLAIHLALAREVKGSAEKRIKLSREMREREARRNQVAVKLRTELGQRANRENINRYLLWQEQGKTCIYSGQPIGLADLFSTEVVLDSILPKSRSLDDSLMNKVLCFRCEHDAKGNRTPYEWLAEADPQRYEVLLQRSAWLPIGIRRPKRAKFTRQAVDLVDAIERQFRDTAGITRSVLEYLQCLGVDVVACKAQLTAELRRRWGLAAILSDEDGGGDRRHDHRYHAVDALVLALTNRFRLQRLAVAVDGESLPPPWESFRREVSERIPRISVSHRIRRTVSGALHEETLYGPTAKPDEFVYRKSLAALTLSMIDHIRDEQVRRLVQARLAEFDIKPGADKCIPAQVWKEPLLMTRQAGRTASAPAKIKRVRLIKHDRTIRPIRNGTAYVRTGSNHHVCILQRVDAKGAIKRESVFVSMLEAARRVRDGEPIVRRVHPDRPELHFLMSLSPGEMVLATFRGTERLVCFRTGASTQGQLYFVDHSDGRPEKEAEKLVAAANTLRGRKVTVDVLGRIRWAND